jgi:LmbE family N-acetylglucosaminyl deacetylase
MLPLELTKKSDEPLEVLCIGAHSDDIEIGCGATILRLAAEHTLCIHWVVLGASGEREIEARRSAEDFLRGADDSSISISGFRNSFFPYDGREIKEEFERIKQQVTPDVVLTHHKDDRHQDHRVVSELTWNTFRDHIILEYEIPKYDAGLGSPNFFVPVSRECGETKIDLILQHFKTQADRSWFDAETFWALLRLRGIECNSASGYAEGFYSNKLVI